MSKLNKLLSFTDYASGKKTIEESVKPKEIKVLPAINKKKNITDSKSPLKKSLKESAFVVGTDYKVKVVLDIPQSLVASYVAKVKKDTGKDALANFTSEELAEELVRYIVKTKLSVENLSAAIAVGEGTGSSQNDSTAVATENITEEPTEEETDTDDPFKDETEEFDLPDEDDEVETEPVKVEKGRNKMDFQGTEVDLGEKDSIELDANQSK